MLRFGRIYSRISKSWALSTSLDSSLTIGPTHFRRVAARAQLADAEYTELKERANELWGSWIGLALAKRAAPHHS